MLKIDRSPGRLRLQGTLGATELPALAEALAAEPGPVELDLSGLLWADRDSVGYLAGLPRERAHVHGGPCFLRTWLRQERRAASVLAIGLLLLAGPAAAEQTPLRLSLQEATERALSAGTATRLAAEQTGAAREEARRARSALLPQVGAAALAFNQTLNLDLLGFPSQDPVLGPFNGLEARISASAPIVDLSALRRWRATQAGVAVSEAERRTTRAEAAAAVARVYVALLRADARVRTVQANTELFERVLETTRRQREAGLVGRLETLRAESQLQRQRELLPRARRERDAARLALLEAMAEDLDREVEPSDPLQAGEHAVPELAAAEAQATARRPELLALREQARAAGLAVSAAEAAKLPVLKAEAFVDQGGNRLSETHFSRGITLQASVPVFTGHRVAAEVGLARVREREVQVRQEAVQRRVAREVRDALASVEAARERLAASSANSAVVGEQLESVRNRLSAGIAVSIEVDSAQTAYAEAREDLVSAQADLAQAFVDLDHATGALGD